MAIWTSIERGVQIRGQDQPSSLIRIDLTKVNRGEFQQRLEAQGVPIQKQFMEGDRFAVFRVPSVALKFPKVFEPEKPAVEPAPGKPEQFTFTGQIREEQLPALKQWAKGKGARLEFGEFTTTKEGLVIDYSLISKRDLTLDPEQRFRREAVAQITAPTELERAVAGFETERDLAIPLPSPAIAQAEREKAQIRKTAEEIVEREPVGATIRTILSPVEGLDIAGVALRELIPSPARIALAKVAPPRDITDIVTAKIEKEIAREEIAKTKVPVFLPTVPVPFMVEERFIHSAIETVQSPPFTVVTAFAGGVGLGAASARVPVVAKALATPIAKVGLITAGAYTATTTGMAVQQDITQGNIDRAIGRVATVSAAIGAGIVGFKVGQAQFPRVEVVSEPKVSEIEQLTVTKPVKEVFVSAGRARIRVPVGKKFIDVQASIAARSKPTLKGKAVQVVELFIPEQKIQGIKIPEQRIPRIGIVEQVGKKVFVAKASEAVIRTKEPFDIVLAGHKRASAQALLVSERKVGATEIRTFTATAQETAGKTQLQDLSRVTRLIDKGIPAKRIGEVPRTEVRTTALANVRAVDVLLPEIDTALITPIKVAPTQPSTAGVPSPPPTTTVTVPAPAIVTPSTIKVITTPAPPPTIITGVAAGVTAPILSEATVVRPMIAIPRLLEDAAVTETRLRPALIPGVRLETRELEREAAVTRAALVTPLITAPRLAEREISVTRQAPILAPITEPIQVQERASAQAFKQVSASAQVTEQVTRTAVPIVPVVMPPTPPPPGIGLPFGVPGLRFPSGRIRVPRFRIRVIVNPVPKQLEIKLPKLR